MNTENEKLSMSLTAKYLSGAATPEGAMELHTMLEDPSARAEFDRVSALWENSGKGERYIPVAADEAWKKIEPMFKRRSRIFNTSNTFKYLVAASIITTLIVAAWIYSDNETSAFIQHAASATVKKQTLPDGSFATLNSNSSISYPEKFSSARKITLNGEAFFQVTHDKANPFEITAGDVKIRVIGTAFNVEHIKNQSTTVQVESGIVQMYTNENFITLTAGQTGNYYYSTKELELSDSVDVNIFGYATRKFIFNNVNIKDACNYLEKAFSVQIELQAGMFDNCRISAAFDNKPLDYILEVVTVTLAASYKMKGNTYFITSTTKNKTCE